MSLSAAWRSRWWIWALPLLFVLANATVLWLHPGRTGAGFSLMEEDLEEETRALRQIEAKRSSFEDLLAVASANREGVRELYRNRFATQAERLTDLLSEVKSLAVRAGFELPRLSYPEQRIGEFELVRKGIDFQVEGSYGQFRNLLNLIELSDYFLVLKQVSLRGSEGSNLAVNLQLTTLFAQEASDEPAAATGGAP